MGKGEVELLQDSLSWSKSFMDQNALLEVWQSAPCKSLSNRRATQRNINTAIVDRQADVDTLFSGCSNRSCRKWLRKDTITSQCHRLSYLKNNMLWEIDPMVRLFFFFSRMALNIQSYSSITLKTNSPPILYPNVTSIPWIWLWASPEPFPRILVRAGVLLCSLGQTLCQ